MLKKLYACVIQARAITDASKPPGIYAPSSDTVIRGESRINHRWGRTILRAITIVDNNLTPYIKRIIYYK